MPRGEAGLSEGHSYGRRRLKLVQDRLKNRFDKAGIDFTFSHGHANNLISLAEGEDFADFAFLFDALVFLRAPYNQDLSLSERIVGRLLCVIFPDKPGRYVKAMQQFRRGFAAVAKDPELRAEFSNSVRRAAITLDRTDQIVWRPSLYFVLPPRLRESKELREWWT